MSRPISQHTMAGVRGVSCYTESQPAKPQCNYFVHGGNIFQDR